MSDEPNITKRRCRFRTIEPIHVYSISPQQAKEEKGSRIHPIKIRKSDTVMCQ
jgi:hypothetical protein